MDDLASIVDYGLSRKQSRWFIEQAWLGEADPEFIEEMQRDPGIEDVCVYTMGMVSEKQFRRLEVL